MNLDTLIARKRFRPACGAAVAAIAGVVLLTPVGDPWINASYDYLFRFGSRPVSKEPLLILLDTEAYNHQQLTRGQPWSRALHAKLLDKLADDGCPLVVLDIFLRSRRDAAEDESLARALSRQRNVVLMAEKSEMNHPGVGSFDEVLPTEPFLSAASNHVGLAYFEKPPIVRRHWPVPSPGPYPSLSWTAAQLAGAALDPAPKERWLRYYSASVAGTRLSYHLALDKPAGYYSNQVVFIGNWPDQASNVREEDEFGTPYTRWTSETVGGVGLHATAFLNLMNRDWLRRPHWTLETLVVVLMGLGLGSGLGLVRPRMVVGFGVAVAVIVTVAGVLLSYFTNFWFPWLVVVGAQVPCALGSALLIRSPAPAEGEAGLVPARAAQEETVVVQPVSGRPEAPEYELFDPPFGEGGFGKVWIVRNAVGQYQALKAVYQSKFGNNPGPYEAEFKGLQKYKPVSERHPGLLRIDLISKRKPEGYFYYVMELGDAIEPGWEEHPGSYRPRDLDGLRRRAPGRMLSGAECLRIIIPLAEALDFLHRQGLTHRDIKPSNVIFVNSLPKLADVGLVTDIRPPEMVNTYVGTAGYIPPPPERAGTVQADIFALGMVLYVISTGREPDAFPELSTVLLQKDGHAEFIHLNSVITKACQPDPARRFKTAAEMLLALQNAQQKLNC